MESSYSIKENICVVSIGINLTERRVNETRKFLASILVDKTIKGLILNCENVQCIDSSGIGFFVSELKILEQRQARLALCHLTPEAWKKLRMLRLDKFFNIYSTEKEALDSFRQ